MQGIKIQLLRRTTDLPDELEATTQSESTQEPKTDSKTRRVAEPKQTVETVRTAKVERVESLAATRKKGEDKPNEERAAEVARPLTEGNDRQEKPGRKSD